VIEQLKYVKGQFEGYYYTHQKSPLGAGEDLPAGGLHGVHLYKGELYNFSSIPDFKTEQYLNRDALWFNNVTNIQLTDIATGDKRIVSFNTLVLTDVKVDQSWEMNGKTYGIIKGTLHGEVRPPDQPKQNDPGTNRIIPPPPNPGGGSPPPPPVGGGGNNLTGNRGCLSRIWDILKWLLLLLLLLLLYKYCNKKQEGGGDGQVKTITDTACCRRADSLQIAIDTLRKYVEEVEKERQRTDRLQRELEERIKREGGKTGAITVSLMWQTKDDLDLGLELPNGNIIYFNNPKSELVEGELDVDNNRSNNELTNEPSENIYINNPPHGIYRIYVNRYTNRSGLSFVPFFLNVALNQQNYSFEKSVYGVNSSSSIRASWDMIYEFQY
jgi:hypothetical protein